MNPYKFAPDVIIHKREEGDWIISNPRAYTHISLNLETLTKIERFISGKKIHNEEKLKIKNVTYFSQQYSLMADPTGVYDSDAHLNNELNSSKYAKYDLMPEKEIVSLENIIQCLVDNKIIIKNKNEYKNYFQVKNHILDKSHIGNFHQRIGYELLKNLRVSPDKFWSTQKFQANNMLLKNLYFYVQDSFFNNFFSMQDLIGKRVLDLGCGTGFYTKKLLELGATLVGVDPNKDYIVQAKKNCENYDDVNFYEGFLENQNDLGKFDWIIISDMLLFYFVSPDPKKNSSVNNFLNLVTKHLKEGGRIFLTEPHGIFWTMPWLGNKEQPYSVIFEYAEKIQKVTPTLEELSYEIKQANLVIEQIYEPKPNAECENEYSKRAYHFAKNFPLWWTFILQKQDISCKI